MKLSGKHRVTLDRVFADPVRSNAIWSDVEAMLTACVPPPHPAKETDKRALKSLRRFLTEARIEP